MSHEFDTIFGACASHPRTIVITSIYFVYECVCLISPKYSSQRHLHNEHCLVVVRSVSYHQFMPLVVRENANGENGARARMAPHGDFATGPSSMHRNVRPIRIAIQQMRYKLLKFLRSIAVFWCCEITYLLVTNLVNEVAEWIVGATATYVAYINNSYMRIGHMWALWLIRRNNCYLWFVYHPSSGLSVCECINKTDEHVSYCWSDSLVRPDRISNAWYSLDSANTHKQCRTIIRPQSLLWIHRKF